MSQDKVSEQADAVQVSQGQILNITLLGSEWNSSAGGLSTLNRELAINLSQIQNVRVSLLVPEGACNDEDKNEARSFGISILDAKKCVGLDPLVWLSNPPQDHKIDVIVGHGVKVGCQVQLIKRQTQFQNCKWVHVVHTASEDLSKYKGYSNPISKGEKKLWDEVDLCKCADLVVPVGPKLKKAYHGYLQKCKKDEDFFELIPGLFEREFGDLAAKQNPKDEKDDFIVLLCGRGDEEDFQVKGYNIAVEAFADQRLKGKHYSLLFVGSPEGKQDEVRERLLKYGIKDEQLTVREFVKSRERMKELFCEVDMVIMPSKSEGFGLVSLEALSAGLPILVGSNSGFSRAIKNIPYGKYSIVGDSGNPAKWAEAIEDVHDRHRVVLRENKMLKEHYSEEYCWKTQCEELVDRLWKMVYGTSAAQAIAADDLVEQCPNVVPESVCQPDPTTMQQHIEKGAVTSGRGKEGTSEDELTLPELADCLIKLKIEAAGLNEEQKKDVYDMLTPQTTTFMKTRKYSKVKVPGVRALLELINFLERGYNLSQVALDVGSLIIILNCKTFKGLDQLWNDYLSGHLNKVAERYLVTDALKTKLNLGKINLKTTIEEENYLNCRKVLMECSGEAGSTTLSSHQSALDQGPGMTGMATAADDEELLVKQEYTDWVNRMEKARASRSALHKASVNGQYEEVKRHLSSGCAVDVKDQFLLTPLHLACWYGQETVVKLLLEHGADVNATDRFQFTPLYKAKRRNHQSIVKLLLEHKARPTFEQPPSLRTLGERAFTRTDERSGFNLLQAAALEGDADTVRKASVHLESFVEEINWRITGEKAPIFPGKSAADILSAVKGRKEGHSLFGIIYEQFVETDITLTELHSCAKRSDVEMVIELVLNYGMDVNVATKRNVTPLLWASPAASSLSIKTLIDLGADVNAQTSQDSNICFCGRTALHSAIHGNNAAVVKVLLGNRADANIGDEQGNTALHSSTSKRFFNISQLLINSGCQINGRNNRGETPLCSAVRVKNVADVKVLLQNNADANLQDTLGNTPLHISTRERFSKISQLLIDSGCKINGRSFMGEMPLHSAVRGENVADVELLLNNNADANLQNTLGDTPLHISTNEGFSRISMLLIGSGCEINRRNYSGRTALHCAVRASNIRHVKLLLMKNADANIQDTFGNSCLHMSTRKGFSNISQLLIDSGCENNVRNNKGETPLYCAVLGKNVADVKVLLKNNANTNIQDTFGNTPLHVSSREGFSNISELLIDSGCEINVRNCSGETPVYCAVRAMSEADVELVLKNNANTNIPDTFGNTPLHISTRDGFSNISHLLIDSGCEIKVKNHRGETPLHSAVCGKNEAAVNLLLKNNANTNIQDTFGNSPLHISSREGFSNISQLLIDSGCNKNLKNREGKTPLEVGSFSPLSGDLEEDKVNEGYASQKSFPDKSFLESEVEDDPWMNQPILSTLSSPIVVKRRSLLKERPKLSSSEGSEPGATRKCLIDRTPLGVEPFSRRSRVSPDFKVSKVYTSQESFRGKTFFESEDEYDPVMEKTTLSTLYSPTVDKLKEQSSIEGSGFVLKKQRELSSSAESEPGATMKHLMRGAKPCRRVSSRNLSPLMNQPTLSPLFSPVVAKLKEKSSIEGSGVLLEKGQELLSGDEPEPAVKRKLERTKGRILRRERSGTNPPPDEK